MNDNDEFEFDTVNLTLEDDTEIECAIVAIFPEEDRKYIALIPVNDLENEDASVLIYKYTEDENGEPGLENIEDDEEYDIAADAFDEYLDQQEFQELLSDDDEE